MRERREKEIFLLFSFPFSNFIYEGRDWRKNLWPTIPSTQLIDGENDSFFLSLLSHSSFSLSLSLFSSGEKEDREKMRWEFGREEILMLWIARKAMLNEFVKSRLGMLFIFLFLLSFFFLFLLLSSSRSPPHADEHNQQFMTLPLIIGTLTYNSK